MPVPGANFSSYEAAMDAAVNIYNADVLTMSYGGTHITMVVQLQNKKLIGFIHREFHFFFQLVILLLMINIILGRFWQVVRQVI